MIGDIHYEMSPIRIKDYAEHYIVYDESVNLYSIWCSSRNSLNSSTPFFTA